MKQTATEVVVQSPIFATTCFVLLAALAAAPILAADATPPSDRPAVKNEVTPSTQPSSEAAKRADRLRTVVKSFALSVWYVGPQDKPLYTLVLHVAPMEIRRVKRR